MMLHLPYNPSFHCETFVASDQAIAKYAAAQLAPATAAVPVLRSAAPVSADGAERGPLAALSTACRFPAGGDDPEIFWTALVPWMERLWMALY